MSFVSVEDESTAGDFPKRFAASSKISSAVLNWAVDPSGFIKNKVNLMNNKYEASQAVLLA